MSQHRPLVFLVALGAVTALTLSACGSSSTPAAAPAASSAAPAGSAPPVGTAATASSAAAPSSALPAASASSPAPSSSAAAPSSSAAGLAGCTPDSLKTQTAGTLTIATDEPAYEPWFVDNNPANGKGFESAVAYAVAKKLGYRQGQGEVDQGVASTPLYRRRRRTSTSTSTSSPSPRSGPRSSTSPPATTT